MVIVRLDTIPDPAGLALETLYQDAVVAVAAPDSAVAAQPDLQWPELASLPWVLPPPGTSARRRYEEAIKQHGIDQPKDLVETASLLSMLLAEARARARLLYRCAGATGVDTSL